MSDTINEKFGPFTITYWGPETDSLSEGARYHCLYVLLRIDGAEHRIALRSDGQVCCEYTDEHQEVGVMKGDETTVLEIHDALDTVHALRRIKQVLNRL
jgi:hypothetical protein